MIESNDIILYLSLMLCCFNIFKNSDQLCILMYLFIYFCRMLGYATFFGRSFDYFAQSILARNDFLPQIEFSALWIFVCWAWKKESRSSIHVLIISTKLILKYKNNYAKLLWIKLSL